MALCFCAGQFEETLKAAFAEGDPAVEVAQQACALHRQWLMVIYPKQGEEYHRGLGTMYAADECFHVNYDKLSAGCTEFLRDAINFYCVW